MRYPHEPSIRWCRFLLCLQHESHLRSWKWDVSIITDIYIYIYIYIYFKWDVPSLKIGCEIIFNSDLVAVGRVMDGMFRGAKSFE